MALVINKGHFKIKHGLCEHPLYKVWVKMKSRCYYKKSECYQNYGGRGVSICDEWLHNPKAFVEWGLSNGWERGLQLDKDIIPKKAGMEGLLYSPNTCCFVTRKQNNLAKRTNRIIEYKGRSQTLMEWHIELNISYSTLANRLNRHKWDVAKAFETPVLNIKTQ